MTLILCRSFLAPKAIANYFRVKAVSGAGWRRKTLKTDFQKATVTEGNVIQSVNVIQSIIWHLDLTDVLGSWVFIIKT